MNTLTPYTYKLPYHESTCIKHHHPSTRTQEHLIHQVSLNYIPAPGHYPSPQTPTYPSQIEVTAHEHLHPSYLQSTTYPAAPTIIPPPSQPHATSNPPSYPFPNKNKPSHLMSRAHNVTQ
ncbi:hypothetical protein P171DRAFT_247249 [Karstenula rhodostoma CBS 690.94]|uniref:Uncharacterized protein n=1 Tax=Karstenula rhodostoma CBS 690.94 TaxID=1392251 RepID=A0A9P4PLA9_9PLEO|nr:hypothetical protein P171DRAFT_247249 [Karstenula rhodostoma CBS 690.94]